MLYSTPRRLALYFTQKHVQRLLPFRGPRKAQYTSAALQNSDYSDCLWCHTMPRASLINQGQMLSSALQPYLPQDPDPYDSLPLKSFEHKAVLRPGFHFLLFPDVVKETNLFPDGTSITSAPGPEWSYRVWAGGSFSYTPNHAFSHVGAADVESRYKPRELSVERGRCLVDFNDHIKIPFRRASKPDIVIVQHRILCFFTKPPPTFSISNMNRGRPPPTGATYTHALTPTSTLLFRYSALTYNAHKIHVDPDFARDVYEAPKIVVNGPLSITLLLQVCARACYRARKLENKSIPIFSEVKYKNLAPLFVDEEMVICCKRETTSPQSPQPHHQQDEIWEAWIQKEVNGASIMALHATVTFRATHTGGDTLTLGQPDNESASQRSLESPP